MVRTWPVVWRADDDRYINRLGIGRRFDEGTAFGFEPDTLRCF